MLLNRILTFSLIFFTIFGCSIPVPPERNCNLDGKCQEVQKRVVGGKLEYFDGKSWSKCKGTQCTETMVLVSRRTRKKYYSTVNYLIPEKCASKNYSESGYLPKCRGYRTPVHSSVLPGRPLMKDEEEEIMQKIHEEEIEALKRRIEEQKYRQNYGDGEYWDR